MCYSLFFCFKDAFEKSNGNLIFLSLYVMGPFLFLGGHCLLDPFLLEMPVGAVLILSPFTCLLAGILDFAKMVMLAVQHDFWIFANSPKKNSAES